MNFWGSNLSWLILIITLLMYFIFAHILSLFYPNYSNKRDVISLLGNPDSPVASIFRVWFILVGLLICVSAINFYIVYNSISHTLASIGAILLFIFGISSGIIAGIFSLDKEKRLKTKASIIHSISVGFGFTCLGFTPIIISLICFKNKDNVIAITSLFCFTLSLIFSTLFILSEKKFFKKTIVGFNGLWQRLFLATLYFPLLLIAVNFIMISSYGK